ncbi:hypothetical protein LOC67_22895 [Stieleria sp. JC731]|uniref:hypothetical protein n=1 Tax=Pirellulaceae TaxID=2691357 RepID=UPI001E2E7696|nr:hypothetical protein [Stieleria sp. JC731]MCC9603407.1 hypothetical protein [Stieleria sp. JC731]
MLFVAPWIALIVVSIIAVPVAAKLAPTASAPAPSNNNPEEFSEGDAAVVGDDFGAAPVEGEMMGDDAFADFQ